MKKTDCLFCDFENSKVHILVAQNDLSYAWWDDNPVNKGHALIVPKNHIESFFDLQDDVLTAMYSLAKATREIIDTKYNPDSYTIGINDGESAGRTIHHLHIHLIPRYLGDVINPRGGIRHIIPGKGVY